MNEDKKQCSRCKENKILSEFSKKVRNNDGLQCQCKSCTREYRQRPEVKKAFSERDRKYRNRHEVKARDKEWREQNKEALSEYQGVYREKNKKTAREYHREYGQRPDIKKMVCIRASNRRARKLLLPDTLTQAEWQHALNYFNGCCAVCDRQMNDMFGEFRAAMDHWIPLTYGGDENPGTVANNIIPLCDGLNGCNTSKNATMPNEWLVRKFGNREAKKIAARIQKYFDSL